MTNDKLATFTVEDIQMRENRWVIADLRGKGNRVRTVAVSLWVKNGFNAWQTAAGIEEGRLFRSVRKGGKVGESLSDWAVAWVAIWRNSLSAIWRIHDLSAGVSVCRQHRPEVYRSVAEWNVQHSFGSLDARWACSQSSDSLRQIRLKNLRHIISKRQWLNVV